MITYYTSPTGNGGGLSSGAPASLSAVKTLVRNTSAVDDITVYVLSGRYLIPAALQFTAADSGKTGKTVYWVAYPGDSPSFSGGVQITGWSLFDSGKNIWRASVTPGTVSRQLYVNGQRAGKSRCPSTSTFAYIGGRDFKTSDNNFPVLSKPADLEIVINATNSPTIDWRQLRIFAEASSKVGANTTITATVNSAGMGFSGMVIGWMENALEFLTAASLGQWYMDSSGGYVYYVPRSGEDMTAADVWLPQTEQLVVCDSSNAPSRVQFRNIAFEHTGWTKPNTDKLYVQLQANMDSSGNFPPAAVSLPYSQTVKLYGCSFKHLGGQGVSLTQGARSGSVLGCSFTDISSNAALLGDFVIRSGTAHNTGDLLVTGNHIHDTGNEYLGATGILIGYVDHTRVIYNHVYDQAYSGVSFGWGWLPDFVEDPDGYNDYINSFANTNEIAWNNIHDVMQQMNDGGAIYTLGKQTGTSIHDNYIKNVGHDSGAIASRAQNSLYLDEGTEGVAVYSNVCISPNGFENHWLNVNNSSGNTGSSNYVTSGMTQNSPSGAGIVDATPLTGTDPTGWSTTTQNIALAAGPSTVISAAINTISASSASATLTGTMSEGASISGLFGGSFGTPSYPTSTSFSLPISGLQLGNNTITVRATLGGLTVDAISAVDYQSSTEGLNVVDGQGAALVLKDGGGSSLTLKG